MGVSALTDYPHAPELFCQMELAASSIPGVLPPALIDVGLDDKSNNEIHVTGSVKTQSFINAEILKTASMQRRCVTTDGGPLPRLSIGLPV